MQKLRLRIYRLNVRFEIKVPFGSMIETVVIGYNETNARKLAAACCGVEGGNLWNQKDVTDCTEIGVPNKENYHPQVLCRYLLEQGIYNDVQSVAEQGACPNL